jgi:hypothetical protein
LREKPLIILLSVYSDWRTAVLGVKFAYDGYGSRSADAVGACFEERGNVSKGANAAHGLAAGAFVPIALGVGLEQGVVDDGGKPLPLAVVELEGHGVDGPDGSTGPCSLVNSATLRMTGLSCGEWNTHLVMDDPRDREQLRQP